MIFGTPRRRWQLDPAAEVMPFSPEGWEEKASLRAGALTTVLTWTFVLRANSTHGISEQAPAAT
jgi:hypothetical protein